MTEGQWRAAWDVYAAAESLPADQAEALLERTDVSPAVRNVVLRMLQSGETFETPLTPAGQPPSSMFSSGATIGRYLLRQKIGEGGMGEVWLAEQQEPVRRRVALKVIKGAGSREVITRFESERQALALMDHPNIAKVFDAGSTAQGAPYFVMEYAEGEPITTWCDNRRLTTRERIQLFIQVCEAVQHAHRKAIIHRDLKPSNILVIDVEGRPTPKIIDFGVAKALTRKLGADTLKTRLGVLVGTPEYMSPEQTASSGLDIDTRTDVYSLGIVLYELLAGARPIDIRQMGLEEFLRRLREEDTPKPSSRASEADVMEVARRRGTEPAALVRQLRGDLDVVVLKALEKDRERRYESAGALARDLERYLAGEAVEAQPASRSYRAWKFATRHRWALGGAAAVMVLLVAAVVWMAVALRQQTRANANAAALREVVRKVMIDRPAQLAQLPNSLKLRSDLMSDVEGALEALSKETGRDRKADLQLARAYFAVANVRGIPVSDGSMDGYAASLKYLDRSADIAGGILREHPDDRDAQKMFLSARLAVLYTYRRLQRFDDAERTARDIAAHAQALPARMHREDFFADYDVSAAFKEIAAIKTSQGRLEESLAMNRRALAAVSGNLEQWLKMPNVKNHLAACYADTGLSEWRLQGYSDEASTLLHRGLAVLEGCREVVCKSRAAELEGYTGLVDWSGGREKDGLLLMQRGVRDFDVLIHADTANDVFLTAARVLRGSYALALVGSQRPDEALAVMRQFMKPGDLTADPRDLLIYGQVLAASRGGESPERYLTAVLQDLDREHQEGFEPQVMRWGATHALANRAERARKFNDAIRLLRAEASLAGQLHTDATVAKIFASAGAAAFARTVVAMPDASAELRSEALRTLDGCCTGLPAAYRVEQAGTIVMVPSAEEVAKLQRELAGRRLR